MSRIAVMGSAFNPPSLGHKDVVEQALKQCDQVWLVPAFRHAWGKSMAMVTNQTTTFPILEKLQQNKTMSIEESKKTTQQVIKE